MKEINVNECHKYLLGMAQIFHNICVENNIPYFMLGGTQLGAVRHHGFVPWDDDMDFGVPRDYYVKLLEVLKIKLPSNYVIHCLDDDDYCYGYAKLEDVNTVIKESGRAGLTFGVNIDIFPLDHTNNNIAILSKNHFVNFLIKIQVYRFLNLDSISRFRNILRRCLIILTSFLNKRSIPIFIEKHLVKNKGDFWANHYGAWGMKEIISKNIFGVPTIYEFAGIKLYGVEKPDDYLKHLYGNYMELPSEDKRHLHIEHLYLR